MSQFEKSIFQYIITCVLTFTKTWARTCWRNPTCIVCALSIKHFFQRCIDHYIIFICLRQHFTASHLRTTGKDSCWTGYWYYDSRYALRTLKTRCPNELVDSIHWIRLINNWAAFREVTLTDLFQACTDSWKNTTWWYLLCHYLKWTSGLYQWHYSGKSAR